MSNLNPGGLTRVLNYIKTWVTGLLNGKANSSHNHTTSQITDFPAYGNTAGTICQGNDSRLSDARTPTSHTHTKSQITDFPTIPTVNNATLKIQKNGTDVKTFTANASTDVTCNITVPTNTNELTNGNGFITSEIDSSGTGWVRFKCGIQICHGNVNNSDGLGRGLTRFTFPKAFNAKPNVTVTPNISARYAGTALIEGSTSWVLNSLALYVSPADYVSDPAAYSYIAVGTWK